MVPFNVTDFAVFSTGIYLFRGGKHEDFKSMLEDFLALNVAILRFPLHAVLAEHLTRLSTKHRLDFDDSYQVMAADRRGRTIISYDGDLRRAVCDCLTPEAAIEKLAL